LILTAVTTNNLTDSFGPRTSLAMPRFIQVIVPGQESKWPCICVLWILGR